MNLALMQPYFFPYVGYFDLICNCNRFVVFDEAQYIKQGWINRNRVLHPGEGWQYVTVPVQKHRSSTRIGQVSIVPDDSWKSKLKARLTHLKSHAPHYAETMDLLDDCLDSDERSISKFNVAIIEKICRFLGIEFNCSYISELGLDLGSGLGPGDWALQLARRLKARNYVNLPGGEDLFDAAAFQKSDIGLCIRKIEPFVYSTGKYVFQENLSIIDVLMWNSVTEIRRYLSSQAHFPNLVEM